MQKQKIVFEMQRKEFTVLRRSISGMEIKKPAILLWNELLKYFVNFISAVPSKGVLQIADR